MTYGEVENVFENVWIDKLTRSCLLEAERVFIYW